MTSYFKIGLWLCFAFFYASVHAEVHKITLPQDHSTLRFSKLPGYNIAVQKCGICHSKNYISFQPPEMSQKAWTAEMKKMHDEYGAPISDDEIKIIGAYLAATYGSAHDTDPAIIAASSLANTATKNVDKVIDVQALLTQNSCLACHGLKNKIVGPGYNEIAKKYNGHPNAISKLVLSIQNGSTGKWGTSAMPPMAGLNTEEATALAKFVLSQ